MAANVKVKDIDHGLKRISRAMRGFIGASTKVGLPAGANVSDGPSKNMSELATVGAVHEFGAPNKNIPERSWLRSAYDQNKVALDQVKEREFSAVLDGTRTAAVAIGRVGEWFTSKVKEKIRTGPFAKLKAATLERKYPKELPLIDTGQMIQSVTHVET